MSDLIAHLLTNVNRRANIETLGFSGRANSQCIDVPTVAGGRASDDGNSPFSEPELRTHYDCVSEGRGSVSERARKLRLAAGPPLEDLRPRRRRRALLRTRSGPPPYWLNCVICEAARLINDRGSLHQIDAFKQEFGPILALYILRERARPDALLDAGAAAARQVRLLVCAEIAADCEAWVRYRLSILRDEKPCRIWRTAGSRSRRGGFKELGVSLGQHFGLTMVERQRLKIRMIHAVDIAPNEQREIKREVDRARAAAKRRAAGVKQRTASEAVETMMRESGRSRASCYRRLAASKAAETGKDYDAKRARGVPPSASSNSSPAALMQ